MDKKILGAVCLFGILVLMGAGCSQSAVVQDKTNPTVPGAGNEAKKPESEQPKPKTTGVVTDEQCMDVLAHQLWAVRLSEAKHDVAASINMVKEAENLQAQYGISDDDFENICNAKIGEMDFMDRVQKRMQDLGYVIK